MGFKQADAQGRGGFVKIWKVENKGKYSTVQMSSWKRDENENFYTDFQHNFVSFVGKAHEDVQNEVIPEKGGLTIQILSCEVTKKYDAENNVEYTNFSVFDYVVPEGDGTANTRPASAGTGAKSKKQTTKPAPAEAPDKDDDDELPF